MTTYDYEVTSRNLRTEQEIIAAGYRDGVADQPPSPAVAARVAIYAAPYLAAMADSQPQDGNAV